MFGLVFLLGGVYLIGVVLTLHEEGGKYTGKWAWPVDVIKGLKAAWNNRGSGPGVE